MLLDAQNTMSNQQTIAFAAGSALSDNSIDLGAAVTDTLGNTIPSDIGRGRVPKLLVEVTETVTSGGSATVTFELVMADDAALTSNLVVLQSTGAIAYATLTAGYQPRLAIPVGVSKRYLGLRYTVATATTTAGKVTASIVLDKQTTSV